MSSMHVGRFLALITGFGGMALATTAMGATATGTGTSTDAHGQWKLIEDYCYKCHNTDDWAGSVAFDTMSAADIPKEGKVFEAAIKKLKSGLMPPPAEKQPDHKAVASLISYLETTLD